MSLLTLAPRRSDLLLARLIRWRSTLTFWIVGLYLVLDWGFMLLRVPPGADFGVPAGELLMLLYVVTLPLDVRMLGPFAAAAPMGALAVWWSIGLTRLVMGARLYGGWALRDATSLIESSYLWIGFLVAAYAVRPQAVWRWFDRVLNIGLCVALTYPFRSVIQDLSPKIPAVSGRPTELFFSYTLSGLLSLTVVLRELLTGRRVLGLPVAAFAGLLIVFVAILMQERTVYLQTFLVLGLVALSQPKRALGRLSPLVLGLVVGGVLLICVVAAGVVIPGRLGADVSVDFYLHHFEAIWGAGADDVASSAHGSAEGVSERFLWWSAIWRELKASPYRLAFGLGYGISLVQLAHDPNIPLVVREPHNSLMSALGRTGIVGLLAYVCVHVGLIWTVVRTYRAARFRRRRLSRRWLLITLGFMLMCWVDAMGEDAFEKPFVCIPYYFLAGAVLSMAYRARAASRPARVRMLRHASGVRARRPTISLARVRRALAGPAARSARRQL